MFHLLSLDGNDSECKQKVASIGIFYLSVTQALKAPPHGLHQLYLTDVSMHKQNLIYGLNHKTSTFQVKHLDHHVSVHLSFTGQF